ncbi:hypothetical protein O159_28370 [Leifsonia xyli subsp. cynodontis DSM 46306]|uniref:Uncharacterized protein n=1 Tax=Leifsonia xyli subsp. cynodontis DSM 46306 TaxID=1389489 RepID=U3PGA4_LEIXC|nr:hypothetical protein [Leifsonia xyli]AGW42713.1 hypothetical protein O159_28370 [Leifsonia xyli subsp. cynodontis DSM 46306]
MRKRVALIVGLVIAALALSGGGAAFALGTRIFEPGPAVAPAPMESPTPTPTPTNPPVAVPDIADPTTWTIGFHGIGPIALGSSMERERQTLAAFSDNTDKLCVPGQLSLVDSEGFSVLLVGGVTDPSYTAAVIVGDWSQDVPRGPTTEAGIGVGSSAERLLSAYPEIERTGSYNDVTTYYGLADGGGGWIVFAIFENRVVSIQVANESNVPLENVSVRTMPSERCPA